MPLEGSKLDGESQTGEEFRVDGRNARRLLDPAELRELTTLDDRRGILAPLLTFSLIAALVPRPRLHLIRFHGVLAPNAKLRAKVVPKSPDEPAQQEISPKNGESAYGRPMRLGWAKLLKRVFNIDMEHCPNCGGELKVIAAILERRAIEKILSHLGLEARAPPRASARGQMALQDF